jgi:hypothetical protein
MRKMGVFAKQPCPLLLREREDTSIYLEEESLERENSHFRKELGARVQGSFLRDCFCGKNMVLL